MVESFVAVAEHAEPLARFGHPLCGRRLTSDRTCGAAAADRLRYRSGSWNERLRAVCCMAPAGMRRRKSTASRRKRRLWLATSTKRKIACAHAHARTHTGAREHLHARTRTRAHTRVRARRSLVYVQVCYGVPTPGVHCMTGGSSKMGSIRPRQRGGTALYHPPLPPPPLLVLVYCRGCAVPLQKMCHSTRSDEARQAACCPALSTETTESDATRRDESGRQRR